MSRKLRKRGTVNDLKHEDIFYLVTGHDMFCDVDHSTIRDKWNLHKDMIMELWETFKPFTIKGFTFSMNKPGTKPWACHNLDRL